MSKSSSSVIFYSSFKRGKIKSPKSLAISELIEDAECKVHNVNRNMSPMKRYSANLVCGARTSKIEHIPNENDKYANKLNSRF